MARSRWLIAFLVLPVVGVVTGTPRGAAAHGGDTTLVHGCVNPAGLMRIVAVTATCHRSETPVDWPKTAATGGGDAPTAVFDSTGRKVGNVVGTLNNMGLQAPAVALRVGDVTVVLAALRTRLCEIVGACTAPPDPPPDPGAVVFESADCAGDPFLFAPAAGTGAESIVPLTTIAGPNDTLFVAAADASPTTVVDGSRLFYRGTCRPGSGIAVGGFVPGTTTIDLAVEFAQPFSIR